MRISDWSSDVCSSDLGRGDHHSQSARLSRFGHLHRPQGRECPHHRPPSREVRPVHVLDLFGVTGIPSAAFNQLDRLDPAGLDLADDAMTLDDALRSEEHKSELQSLMRRSYAVYSFK